MGLGFNCFASSNFDFERWTFWMIPTRLPREHNENVLYRGLIEPNTSRLLPEPEYKSRIGARCHPSNYSYMSCFGEIILLDNRRTFHNMLAERHCDAHSGKSVL